MAEPQGTIIKEWTEFGHRFQIEQLAEPVLRGAGLRRFRLWDNGSPAVGGQYHYTEESAKKRAEYLLLCSYSARVNFLETRVNELERELYYMRGGM